MLRLACRNWEDAARFVIKKKGRIHWGNVLQDLISGCASLDTIGGSLGRFHYVMLCPFETPRVNDFTRICIDRLTPELKKFAFPYAKENFIVDATICVSFNEYRNWIYSGNAIYFLDRFSKLSHPFCKKNVARLRQYSFEFCCHLQWNVLTKESSKTLQNFP